jgi:molybdopterin/thiamine biosynthesis adenylyltransferase/rhodanese-related sulfurtransferase
MRQNPIGICVSFHRDVSGPPGARIAITLAAEEYVTMKTYRDLVAEAKRAVPEVSVEDVHARLARGEALGLIDVRDPDEYREGAVDGAVPISRGFLEFKVPEAFPDPETPLVLYCLSGLRSLLAGKVLHDLGYTNVTSMAGGIRRWKELKLPLVKDQPLTPDQMERYSRHFMLTQVGEPGQKQLLRSKALLIGAGGLGSPTAFYLAAAGVGTLGIVDDDVSTLEPPASGSIGRRTWAGLGRVRPTITALNPDVTVVPYAERLTVDNIERIIKDYDIIVDGSDNFATRYLVNDACYLAGKPNVHGSIFQFEGMVTVLAPGRGPCYRCLYPVPPPAGLVPS